MRAPIGSSGGGHSGELRLADDLLSFTGSLPRPYDYMPRHGLHGFSRVDPGIADSARCNCCSMRGGVARGVLAAISALD